MFIVLETEVSILSLFSDRAWNDNCPASLGREMVKMLVFLVADPTVDYQIERFESHVRDFARISSRGYVSF